MISYRVLCTFLISCCVCLTDRDLYEVLGLSRDATVAEIKSTYKKLARKYHPDANNEEDTTEIFQEIAYAKEILTDEEKKNTYDKYGHDGLEKMADQPQGDGDPFGMFGQMFGFGQQQEVEKRGQDIVVPLLVTLEELFTGTVVTLTKTEKQVRDAPGFRNCNCRLEMRQQQVAPGQFQMYQEEVCEQCPNIRLIDEDIDLDVTVEAGMHHGTLLKYPGHGEFEVDGDNGDLIIGIHLQRHPIFERIGDDLYTNVTISLKDALLGFETELTHLDGDVVKVSRKSITWNGFKQRLLNKGMPKNNISNLYEDKKKRGVLVVTFDIDYPDLTLSDEDKKQIENILQMEHEPSLYNGIIKPNKV